VLLCEAGCCARLAVAAPGARLWPVSPPAPLNAPPPLPHPTPRLTPKTDVFAFGVLLYELLSRRLVTWQDDEEQAQFYERSV
jgi:hypothetical protein